MDGKKLREKPQIPIHELRDFCARHRVRRLYLFGSILTDDFNDERIWTYATVDVPEFAASLSPQ